MVEFERTLSILKPDVVKANLIGAIVHRIEAAGLQIIAMKMVHLDRQQVSDFYVQHQGQPFFNELIDFMSAASVVLQVVQGRSAVRRYRELIGATNPAQALSGTIRADYGQSMGANAVHGSDSLASAAREIRYFFSEHEIYPRSAI